MSAVAEARKMATTARWQAGVAAAGAGGRCAREGSCGDGWNDNTVQVVFGECGR